MYTVLQFQVSSALKEENELLRENIAQLVPTSDSGLEVQTCLQSGAVKYRAHSFFFYQSSTR